MGFHKCQMPLSKSTWSKPLYSKQKTRWCVTLHGWADTLLPCEAKLQTSSVHFFHTQNLLCLATLPDSNQIHSVRRNYQKKQSSRTNTSINASIILASSLSRLFLGAISLITLKFFCVIKKCLSSTQTFQESVPCSTFAKKICRLR